MERNTNLIKKAKTLSIEGKKGRRVDWGTSNLTLENPEDLGNRSS
jgi:hypothetical protein